MTDEDDGGADQSPESGRDPDVTDDDLEFFAFVMKGLDEDRPLLNILAEHVGFEFPVHVARVRSTLNVESDRGVVLVAAAHLDDRLGELLRISFVDDDKAAEQLLSESRPLGSFSARITLAYCLGLVSAKSSRTLHLIRKIRNEFAHGTDTSFGTPSIAARCRELDDHDGDDGDVSHRVRFIENAMGLSGRIEARISRAVRPTPAVNGPPSPEVQAEIEEMKLKMRDAHARLGRVLKATKRD